MLNLLKWSVVFLIMGCLDAPAPPTPPGAAVNVQIGDLSGHHLDSVKFSTYDSLCFQALLPDSLLEEEIQFRWIIGELIYDTSQSYCPPIIKGSIGKAIIILEAEDSEGNVKSDSVFLLANTPPVFDTSRSSFFPREDALVDGSSGPGILFTWVAMDHDDFDTLSYILRIGQNGHWTDSLYTLSPNRLLWPGNLSPNEEYEWQVVVLDWLNDRDSTPVFHFKTKETWDQPYFVKGFLQYPYPGFPQLRSKITILVEAPSGDTLQLPLEDDFSFHFFPGPQSDSLLVYAFDSVSQESSDSFRVFPSSNGPVFMADTLEFQ